MSAIPQMTDKTFSLDLGILLMDENPLLRRNLKSKFKSGGYSNIFLLKTWDARYIFLIKTRSAWLSWILARHNP